MTEEKKDADPSGMTGRIRGFCCPAGSSFVPDGYGAVTESKKACTVSVPDQQKKQMTRPS